MEPLSLDRQLGMMHFVSQARAWLERSEEGRHAIPLSYAAFELRLAVERICMEYYVKILGSEESKKNQHELGSFKKMKARIFSVAGHQSEINKHFEFTRCIFEALRIEVPVSTPNLGRLSAIWHECSEPCHIFWNIAESREVFDAVTVEDPKYTPYADLVGYAEELASIASSTITWMQVMNPDLVKLMKALEPTENCAQAVRDHFANEGLHAVFHPGDGSPSFSVGTAIEAVSDSASET
jgi:hypothetical protein